MSLIAICSEMVAKLATINVTKIYSTGIVPIIEKELIKLEFGVKLYCKDKIMIK